MPSLLSIFIYHGTSWNFAFDTLQKENILRIAIAIYLLSEFACRERIRKDTICRRFRSNTFTIIDGIYHRINTNGFHDKLTGWLLILNNFNQIKFSRTINYFKYVNGLWLLFSENSFCYIYYIHWSKIIKSMYFLMSCLWLSISNLNAFQNENQYRNTIYQINSYQKRYIS